jgi:hypothetical protein
VCKGRGYILANNNNVHGLRIERCDKCMRYVTDDQAALKAYEDGGPIAAVRPRKKQLPMFTVVLLYPDYATGDYGADIYVECVPARDEFAAAKKVQQLTHRANRTIRAADFRPILVLADDCQVLADATSFEVSADVRDVECYLENDGKVLAVGIPVPVATKGAKR